MVTIRKLMTIAEEILADGGRPATRPVRKVAAPAAIANAVADAVRAERLVRGRV